MPISGNTDAASIVITLILGSFATMITLLYNHLMKNRQERLEMEKHRLETLSKAAPYYSQLALFNCWNVSALLQKAKEDSEYRRIMYFLCNTLCFRHIIIQTFGDIQLDNLEAEYILGDLGRTIVDIVNNGFGFVDASRMRCLVENDLPYHRFHESISKENKDLYQKFVDLISNHETKQELEKNCRWYSELIMLELNHIYEPWYGEPPDLSRVDGDLKAYLAKNRPRYYNRIMRFEIGGHTKKP